MPLVLELTEIPIERAHGVYVIGQVAGRLPARARFLYPDAAGSFLDSLSEVLVISDMFRSPESSLAAVRSGRGARAPGFSGHNYGLALDLDVRATMRRLGVRSKAELDEWMETSGWFCHRRDHAMTALKGECHHFNFLGAGAAISARARATSEYVEAKILSLYGDAFRIDASSGQRLLQQLKLYHGEIDGEWGPLSREACRVFQRGWGLAISAKLDERTQRTLAYVTCQRRVG